MVTYLHYYDLHNAHIYIAACEAGGSLTKTPLGAKAEEEEGDHVIPEP